jgi:type IV secretion system protein VirD4
MGAGSGKAGSMEALSHTTDHLAYLSGVSLSKIASFFSISAKALHTARFARLHEAAPLYHHDLEDLKESLLLGRAPFNRIASVRPTKRRPQLGNLLVCAPTGSGKSLLAISQALTWPHSLVINDIKGELYDATAAFREKLGPIRVFDHRGLGNGYDPLHGKTTEDALYSAATHLLFEPNEGDGKVFTQRAIEMLTFMWLASRKEGIAPFPYLRFLDRLGPEGTAARLNIVSPDLATQFLQTDYANFLKGNYDTRFLLSCWGTLTARLRPLLNETVIRSLTRSDFTPAELICSDKPITVYIRWREQDLLPLSPLVRLLWSSIIDELTTTYDDRPGRTAQEKGCKPVLLLIDEGGRTAIPNLHDAATTVRSRQISIWLAIQSLEQLSAIYGRDRGNILLGNCATQLYYRPNDLTTARYLEERLGTLSAYAHSQTLHAGEETSEGLSERPIPLLLSQDVELLSDDDVIVFHKTNSKNNRPLKLKRMNWHVFPFLKQRASIKAPSVAPLPPITDIELSEPKTLPSDDYSNEHDDPFPVTLDDPDDLPTLPAGRQDLFDPQSNPSTTVWQRTSRKSKFDPDAIN